MGATKFIFGLGLCGLLGFECGILGVTAWRLAGRPDFYVRPGGETIAIVMMALVGVFPVGVIFGALLTGIWWRGECTRSMRLRTLILCILSCAAIHFPLTYVIIVTRIPAFFVPEILVFVACCLIARSVGRRS